MTKSVLLSAGVMGSALVAGFLVGRASTRSAVETAKRDRDIARREAEAAQLQARTDPLTGLANRAGLTAELVRRAAGGEPWVLLLVDLDDFKKINDTYGHAAGDAVLVEVAQRLTAICEQSEVLQDLVARIGGDEFIVVAGGELPWAIAHHVRLALRRPVLVAGRQVTVTASIGLVQALPSDSARAVLHSADTALYGAKTHGKDRAVEYDPRAELVDVETERPAVRLRDLAETGRTLAEVSDGR